MSLNLSGTDLIGLGKLLTPNASSAAAAKPATSSTSIQDLLTSALSNSSSYVQGSLTRGEALGNPTPIVPMITLEEFINQLVVALAELFRARGYERIADYLLTQHDLDAVFGQLATRMLAIYNQSQRRQSLIQKFLRVNSGVASLLTENQQDLTFNDTPDTVLSMSSNQLNQLNQLLNGYSDSTGTHIGLNNIANQAVAAVLNAPITALQTAANAGELLDPTDGLVKGGINTAVSLAQQVKNQINNNNPQFALITSTANNTSATNDTNQLITTSKSLLASDYSSGNTVNAMSDLNNIVTSATAGATPLFPPLYQNGTSYSWNSFITYGYQVYQCTNTNGTSGSPVSDPNSWTLTSYYPAGSAYQMNQLTSVVSNDISYMKTYGDVSYNTGSNYIAGQNVIYNNNPYYATQNLTYDSLGAGSFPSNDAVSYQGSYYLNKSGNTITVTPLTDGMNYTSGQLVYYNNQIYQATTSGTYHATSYQTTTPPPPAFAQKVRYYNGNQCTYNGRLYQFMGTGYENVDLYVTYDGQYENYFGTFYPDSSSQNTYGSSYIVDARFNNLPGNAATPIVALMNYGGSVETFSPLSYVPQDSREFLQLLYGEPGNENNNYFIFFKDIGVAPKATVTTVPASAPPSSSGSGFSLYNPANDPGNWSTYNPANDATRWTAGASPTLLAKQKELQTILPPLQSLFNTTNFTPGLRQDLLDLCQSSSNQTVFPVISTFYPQMAANLSFQQYANLFTTWTNQLNQSGPAYSTVQASAQTMLNQLNNQIQSSSLNDSNQFWAQIKTQLSSLISACQNSNQSAALAAIGPLAPTPDNDPNGTSLIALMQNQYSLMDISDQWDYITNHIPLSGAINTSDSPLSAMIGQIQTLQGYITRIQQGDTSIPRAQFFNLMKNTLENIYDYQPITSTAVFSQNDYTADQNLLAQAMLLQGSGAITVNESLQYAESLGVTSALGSTLIGLYRDIYQATGNTSGVNQINAFLASQTPQTSGFNGYLRQGSNALSILANDAGNGLNTTTEKTGMNATKHLGGFKMYKSSRKATLDSGWLALKKDYDQYKGLLPAALQGVNTDLLFAADQYVGDNYIAGSQSQVSQRVYYNGQFYKAITSSYDSPTTGINTGTWELMNWNPNRSSQYVFGDIVSSNGLMYRCLNDHQPSSDPSVTPGNTRARNTWACLNFQSGYTYLPGDTVLVSSGDATKPFTPCVALIQYTSGGSGDLGNATLWQTGYNNAVTMNNGSPTAAATLNGLTAIVNGSNTRFDPTITSGQLNSNYAGNVAAGTIFTTLLNAYNQNTFNPFKGWCDVTNSTIATNTTNAITSGGTATTYDGMQFFNPALTLATQVMETLQMIDLFFYARQTFNVTGGGNYYNGFNCPMIALTFGTVGSGGGRAFEVTFAGQSTCFNSTNVRNIYNVFADKNMGQTYGNGNWSAAQLNAANNFYAGARSLAAQLKGQVSGFQDNYNSMILAVQKETYRLLAQSFINTIDLQSSLQRLFRNAPLSDDEKKLLAKILAAILSLLVAILGSDPRIQDAFTTQSVTSLSAKNTKVTETQWTFNTALSGVTIAQSYANDIIAKAIALANEMLSEKSRSSSITSDRLTTQNYLNMNALIKGQQEALEHLDAKTSAGTTYV